MSRDPRLEDWLRALLATPGLTAIAEPEEAWRVHVEEALTALPFVDAGPVVDVGSGGGSPGLPLAAARPGLRFDLLESSRRKCDFLRSAARDFANVRVIQARAEEHGRDAGRDAYGVAVARALAPPPVAVEWCLPLVRPGGRLVLFAGRPDTRAVAVSREVGGGAPATVPAPPPGRGVLLVFPKLVPTPARFPRRPGVARRRPLA